MKNLNLLELLYAALRSPAGVRVPILEGEFEHARQKLYAARREAGDPALDSLSITASPNNPGELFIVRRPDNNA